VVTNAVPKQDYLSIDIDVGCMVTVISIEFVLQFDAAALETFVATCIYG